MKKITFFIVLLVYSIGNAQFNFSSKTVMENVNTAEGVSSIQNVDIDGDGDKDLLSGDYYNVKWFENVGGNNSQLISHQVANTGASFCTYADFDGDGDMDVVFQDYNHIYWSKNIDGHGNFSEPNLIAGASDTMHSISIIDFDLDNDIDIVYSYRAFASSSSLNWLENTSGQGDFAIRTILNGSNSKAIYAVDIDHDNDIDIFSLNNNTQKIEKFTNNGALNFTVQVVGNGWENGYGTFSVADIDNDTDLDLIAASSAGYSNSIEELNVFKNNGSGTLTLFRTLVTNGIGISHLIAKDLDNDNDIDIALSCYNADKLSWFKNTDGQGNFSTIQVINAKLNGAKGITAYDFDADNDIDVVATSQIDDKIVWHENLNSQASFATEKILTKSINYPIKSILSDIDGDGKKDVVTVSNNDGKISWYKKLDDQGNFGTQNLVTADLMSAANVVAIDLDRDGDIDIVSGENYSSSSQFVWYENLDGHGKFSEQHLIGYNRGLVGLAAADFDNDGDADIINTGGSVESTISWFKNRGNGTFDAQTVTLGQNEYGGGGPIISDINGDGKPDFILQHFSGLVWYANNGSGGFTEKMLENSFYQGYSFGAEDLDGDGDMDLVSSNLSSYYGNSRIVWHENLDGLGNFGPVKIIDPNIPNSQFGGYSIDVYAKDLDSDGDIDIVGKSDHNSKIVWYENIDGKGNFALSTILYTETGFNINSLFLEDINNDGYIDILASINNDNYLNTVKTDKIVYYKNSGPAYNKINGFVRMGLDENDCDLPVNNLKVITNDGTNDVATFTTKSGYYQFYVNPGNYTTRIPTTLGHFNVSAPVTHNSSFANIGNIDVANFCLYPSQIVNDLKIVLIPLSQARPGFDASYQIVYNNIGTTQLSGTVKLNFDDTKLVLDTTSSVPSLQTPNSLTFDYSNLNPFETRTIDLNFHIFAPPTVEINQILEFTASIEPVANDLTPEDNTYVLRQTLIGSFDPNDITCLEGEKITMEEAKKYVNYVIRFQNTGTASAINVRVENTLEDKLDWSTFQLINSSHKNRVEIKEGNKVSFIFDKINLPHKSYNEPGSHGFISYKIKSKTDVELGDVIANKADIFFDYNLPIITNTALTEIGNEDTTIPGGEDPSEAITLYPLPVSDVLTIASKKGIIKIEIYNELGQLAIFNANLNAINVSSLSTGFYICKITDASFNTVVRKMMKK